MKIRCLFLIFLLRYFDGHTQLNFNLVYDVNQYGSFNNIVSGDFNLDGKLDIAASSSYSNTISFFKGLGNGTFATPSQYSVCSNDNPNSIIAADFNNDGKLDILTSHSYSNTISVILGNGNGSFNPPIYKSLIKEPYKITTGDLNSDGNLDLVMGVETFTNFTNNYYFAVLFGQGNGNFSNPIYYNTNTKVYGLVIADYNTDGYMDITLTNIYSDIAVYFGNSGSTFSNAPHYTFGYSEGELIPYDINGDGKVDFITSFSKGAGVAVNDGNGMLSNNLNDFYSMLNGSNLTSNLVVEDFNGDGRKDIAGTGWTTNIVSFLLGTNTNSFTSNTSYTICNFWDEPRSIASGDFNSDGKLDLAVLVYTTTPIRVLLNNSIPANINSNLIDEKVIDIYPNPCDKLVTIKFKEEINQPYILEIYNSLGQIVLSEKKATKEATISIENLPNGVYFLRLFNKSETISTHKLIKK